MVGSLYKIGKELAKEAIVLLNMGGPNNLEEVEVFLKNMFADKNILTMKSNLLRKFIGGVIVFSRTESAQEVYRQLGGKSPIVGHTKKLVKKLQNRVGDEVVVDFAMRYTPPFATEVIRKLNEKKVKNIYLIPLYPQYSTTTTKSSLEDFKECYDKVGDGATIFERNSFFKNERYNKAIIKSIKKCVNNDEFGEFDLIFSAHGLPQKIIDAGDVYEKHINQHVKILTNIMKNEDINFNDIHLAYQSKVGRMKWLEPSLQTKLKAINNKKVIIFPIAFTIDNSETDFELSVEYKEIADEFGFKDYRVCKCPNDDELFIDALIEIYGNMR